jgi:NAD(P)-dependent dehydrogenase (short-subunit alcohol dehydrogenase family)
MIFDLTGKVAVITGAAGTLGKMHSQAIESAGGTVVKTDVTEGEDIVYMDVTDKNSIQSVANSLEKVDILINNAALNPKITKKRILNNFENYSIEAWNQSLAVNLTGPLLCSQVFIKKMVENKTKGIVLNIASDLGIIAPDQRIYKNGYKPIDYSVTKHGLIGMTKYLATYYANKGIRVNALSPSGIYSKDIPEDFVERLTNLIPMGRMANLEDYIGAVIYLCSDASSYMTGNNLIIDGGRTIW